jgi:undecaprenyl-diphosphatase
MAFEEIILKAVYGLVGTSGFVDGVLMFCARFLIYIVVVVFLEQLLVHREPYERLMKIFYSGLALILSVGVLQGVLDYFIFRPNPATALGLKTLMEGAGIFPALATTWAVSIAAIASIALSKRLGTWFMAVAFIIGFAQLYTGLYWPLDIIVSFMIGIIGPLIAKRFIPPTKS